MLYEDVVLGGPGPPNIQFVLLTVLAVLKMNSLLAFLNHTFHRLNSSEFRPLDSVGSGNSIHSIDFQNQRGLKHRILKQM